MLEFASPRLKDKKKVCMAAIRQNAKAFRFASDRLRHDKKMCYALIQQDRQFLETSGIIPQAMRLIIYKELLVATKLSLLKANVGAEYELPHEMVEEVCGYICPISRKPDTFDWLFNLDQLIPPETPTTEREFSCMFHF